MTPGDGLLRAILADPSDDTPRLVYADWLDERAAPCGELVRLQCAWRKLQKWQRKPRAELEARERALLEGRGEVAGPLRQLAAEDRPLLALDTGLLLFLHAAAAPAAPEDGMPAGSVWRGSLRQTTFDGSFDHPTVLTVTERAGSRLTGTMRQNFTQMHGTRQVGHFSLEGVFVSGRYLAFVTGKVRGRVMVPSLFQAELDGRSLGGTWRSPLWGQQGTFALRRARR